MTSRVTATDASRSAAPPALLSDVDGPRPSVTRGAQHVLGRKRHIAMELESRTHKAATKCGAVGELRVGCWNCQGGQRRGGAEERGVFWLGGAELSSNIFLARFCRVFALPFPDSFLPSSLPLSTAPSMAVF
ncbi:hypothetical protein Cni_G18091 [Canna indica]|uniref:Uncharacterized protein n=1 Tax=Canna indica TaxID=4628 RepID=A0AAQ3KLK2_9LILI|nr:hypothetical protein Cni_G18091 [Canna indica]